MNTDNTSSENQLFLIIDFIIKFFRQFYKQRIVVLFIYIIVGSLLSLYFYYNYNKTFISQVMVYQTSNNELIKIKQLEKILDFTTSVQPISSTMEKFYYTSDLAYENFVQNLKYSSIFLKVLESKDIYKQKFTNIPLKDLAMEFHNSLVTTSHLDAKRANLSQSTEIRFFNKDKEISTLFLRDLLNEARSNEKRNLFKYIVSLMKTATQIEENRTLSEIELTKQNIDIAEDLNIKDPIVEKKLVIDQFEIKNKIINLAAQQGIGGIDRTGYNRQVVEVDKFLLGTIYLEQQLEKLEDKYDVLQTFNSSTSDEEQIFQIFSRPEFKNIFPGFQFADFFKGAATPENLTIEPVQFDIATMSTSVSGKSNLLLISFIIFIIASIFVFFYLIIKVVYEDYKTKANYSK